MVGDSPHIAHGERSMVENSPHIAHGERSMVGGQSMHRLWGEINSWGQSTYHPWERSMAGGQSTHHSWGEINGWRTVHASLMGRD